MSVSTTEIQITAINTGTMIAIRGGSPLVALLSKSVAMTEIFYLCRCKLVAYSYSFLVTA